MIQPKDIISVEFTKVKAYDELIRSYDRVAWALSNERMKDPISEKNVGMLSIRVLVKDFKITNHNWF